VFFLFFSDIQSQEQRFPTILFSNQLKNSDVKERNIFILLQVSSSKFKSSFGL
jgi:hypothetical protein